MFDFLRTFLYNSFKTLKKKIMAVPKKRTSKSKKNSRKATWKRKADKLAQKALSLSKSFLTGKTTSFIYTLNEEE
jgi:large subunit ribosomal protein L32